MFEHHTEPLLAKHKFRKRLSNHAFASGGLLLASVAIGCAGFHWLAGQSWIDALLNSCMLLGGMGPVGEIQSTAGKLFASFFALFAGIVFIASVTVLFVPVIHRFLHAFHLEGNQRKKQERTADSTEN